MHLTVIMHFYNEEYLLPFWLNHHKTIFDYGVLIDYNSTDKSVDIIKQIVPNWTIIKSGNPDFDSGLCDVEVMNIEKRLPGWKIAINVTEFICCDSLHVLIDKYKDRYNALSIKCVSMIESQKFEQHLPIDVTKSLLYQRTFGVIDGWRKTRTIHCSKDGHYNENNDVGRHQPHVYPFIEIEFDEAIVLWYGFSPFNKAILKRKCQIKRPNGYYTEEMFIDEFENYQSKLINFKCEPIISKYFLK